VNRPITLLSVLVPFLLSACDGGGPVRFFQPDEYPARLSKWGLFRLDDDRLELSDGVVAYDLNTPLFTDYAQKLRTIYLPPGEAAAYHPSESFTFPVGTVISKTFFYPKGATPGVVKASYRSRATQPWLDRAVLQVLETRLLVRQADGWDALPYVWRGDDAVLMIAGDLSRLEIEYDDGSISQLPYIVPTRNECAACHATDHTSGELKPIGLKARHLNRGYLGHPPNQLVSMATAGRLAGLPQLSAVPRNADATGQDPVADKARAYLDANCGHCHNPKGAADTSGLLLDTGTSSTRALGICKPPIAAGQGTGGHLYSIVPGQPEASILIYRMATDDPGSRMPELGRSLVHAEGVALLSSWISDLEGECISSKSGT